MTFNNNQPNSNQRRWQEYKALEKLWNKRLEKCNRLEQALVHENDEARKIQLEKQIQDEKTQLNHLETQLSNIESMFPQPQIRQSQNDENQQELPNRDISEIDQEIKQAEVELRRLNKPTIISSSLSFLKALRIQLYTRKNGLIIFIVFFLCGFIVVQIFHIWPFNQQVCKSPAADVSDIDFSPDGKYLATASLDKTVQILKVTETTNQKNEISACSQETEGVVAVKFSPPNRPQYLATASLDSASLWEVKNDGIISRKRQDLSHKTILPDNMPYHKPVVAIDFSQDGKYLGTASADGEIKVWNIKTLKPKVLPTPQGEPKAYIVSVSFSHDGNYIVTADVNDIANVWELKADDSTLTPRLLKSIPDVTDVAFNWNNGNKIYLATARANGSIEVWDISNLEKPATSLKHSITYVRNVRFSPSGKFLAAIGLDKKVSLWDWKAGTKAIPVLERESLNKNTNVAATAFSLDDKYLAIAHTDGTVRVWNTTSEKEVNSLKPQVKGLMTVAFSPRTGNGEYLAMAGADGQIEIRKFERK